MQLVHYNWAQYMPFIYFGKRLWWIWWVSVMCKIYRNFDSFVCMVQHVVLFFQPGKSPLGWSHSKLSPCLRSQWLRNGFTICCWFIRMIIRFCCLSIIDKLLLLSVPYWNHGVFHNWHTLPGGNLQFNWHVLWRKCYTKVLMYSQLQWSW